MVARTNKSARLIMPRTSRTFGLFRSTPAPAATLSAQRKSPVQAPSPTRHVAQNPPPCSRGSKPRRIISAFTGPGGHATDQPSTNPLIRIDIVQSDAREFIGRWTLKDNNVTTLKGYKVK